LPNVIKIDPYNFELYRFNVGAFFEKQCSSHNETKAFLLTVDVYKEKYQIKWPMKKMQICM